MKTIKKWQEPIYAIGGFGPGFMYQVVLTYLLYYYRPAQARIEAGAWSWPRQPPMPLAC